MEPLQSNPMELLILDVTWLQCQPCQSCFKQTTPIFNPSKSKTYKTISCTSNTCGSVQGTCAASTGSCKYDSSYADGTFSQGDLILETLTLGSTNASPVRIPGIAIGCALKNGVPYERGHSGIVVLWRGPVSLINQLGPSIGGKFSYCLPVFLEVMTCPFQSFLVVVLLLKFLFVFKGVVFWTFLFHILWALFMDWSLFLYIYVTILLKLRESMLPSSCTWQIDVQFHGAFLIESNYKKNWFYPQPKIRR